MANFKEHAIERPDFLGEFWYDSSWHTDACAHATLFLTPDESCEGPVVEFWVNYSDPKDRTIPLRYDVVFQRSFELESSDDATLWAGDEEHLARGWARAAEIAKTIATEVVASPELLRALTFSQLHDYCDANCLGNQEAFLTSCGWTGENDAKDEEALNASVEVLNGAQCIVDSGCALAHGDRRLQWSRDYRTATQILCTRVSKRVWHLWTRFTGDS